MQQGRPLLEPLRQEDDREGEKQTGFPQIRILLPGDPTENWRGG